MKIWIGEYSYMGGGTYNQVAFTDYSQAEKWLEQANLINANDADDIGSYSLYEIETDLWDGKNAVPYYTATIAIDVEQPQHERSKVYYYKQLKFEVDERLDNQFDNHNLKWAKEHMIEQGMNYMHCEVYAHSKQELLDLVERTFNELGMQPQITVYSDNWGE